MAFQENTLRKLGAQVGLTKAPSRAALGSRRGRLEGRDGDRVDDVFGLAAAREVVGRTGEPLEDRADRGGAREPLGELVGDVARVEVWEDEDVGPAGRGRACGLARGDRGDE